MLLSIEVTKEQGERIAVASLIDETGMGEYMVKVVMQQVEAELYESATHGSGSQAMDHILAMMYGQDVQA